MLGLQLNSICALGEAGEIPALTSSGELSTISPNALAQVAFPSV